MTLEFITTAANVATLIVLLCGAVAALIQLRALRTGNELAAVLAVHRSFAEPELQAALLYVAHELDARLTDGDYRAELAARGYIDPSAHPEMVVCNWFNDMGTMIAGNFVDEAIFFDAFGRIAEYEWQRLGPAIALLRRERGPEQYAHFELLAERAAAWRARYAHGRYPAGAPRLPLTDPWAAVDAAPAVG